MKHFFLSQYNETFPQWLEAFPSAQQVAHINDMGIVKDSFIWVIDSFPQAETIVSDMKNRVNFVVVMSLTPSVADSIRFFEAGALGYCHALASPVMLYQVAESVQSGGIWIGAELMQQMVHRLLKSEARPINQSTQLAQLTPKEKQVADLVAQGLTNKEVAKELSITDRTVKAHLSSAFDKLNVRDRIQLALLIRSE